jgi:hypothetical protein
MDLAIPTWIAGLLATGMGVALLGSVKVPLARRLQMDEARVGGLVSMFGFAMIPVILGMGFLTDRFGPQLVCISGSALMAASLVILARSGRYWSALLAVLLLSAGWSALINVLNVGMQAAFGGSETYAMNFGNFFFGLGAFLTPLAIAFLLRRTGLAPAVLVLAAFALVSGLLAFGVDFKELTGTAGAPAAAEGAAAGIGVLLCHPIMWLCALALLFYAPLEATMAAWATTYLGGKGISEGTAATFLSGFWLAFMGSRLGTALTTAYLENTSRMPEQGPTLLIVVLSGLCLLVWAAVVFSRSRGLAITLVIAAGLVYGPIFPTLVGALLNNLAEYKALHGRAVGLFFAIGGIGWTVIPMLIGAYAQKRGVQQGFRVAAAAAAGLLAMALALHFTVSA